LAIYLFVVYWQVFHYVIQNQILYFFLEPILESIKPVATYRLPVGGLPNNDPVFVPLSCTSFLSGMAAITAYAYFFAPSGPLRNFSGRTV
jgi:hypothetical protein